MSNGKDSVYIFITENSLFWIHISVLLQAGKFVVLKFYISGWIIIKKLTRRKPSLCRIYVLRGTEWKDDAEKKL